MSFNIENFQNLINEMNKEKEKATAKGICIKCQKPPTFYSEAGKREYHISGLCEPCFDNITKEEEQ